MALAAAQINFNLNPSVRFSNATFQALFTDNSKMTVNGSNVVSSIRCVAPYINTESSVLAVMHSVIAAGVAAGDDDDDIAATAKKVLYNSNPRRIFSDPKPDAKNKLATLGPIMGADIIAARAAMGIAARAAPVAAEAAVAEEPPT